MAHGGLTATATDNVAVLDILRIEQAHIIGYSMGAVDGYGLLRYYPDRCRSMILGGGPDYNQVGDPEELLEWKASIAQILRQGPAALLSMHEELFGELPEEHRAEILQTDMLAMEAVLQTYLATPIPDEVFTATNVRCLLWAGHQDIPTCDQVKHIASLIPNTELHVLPDLDHAQACRERDLILPYITSFLDRVEVERKVS